MSTVTQSTPASRTTPAVSRRPARRGGPASRWTVLAVQIVILAMFLVAWEYLPRIPAVSNTFSFADPFFISSPSRIVRELGLLLSGSHGAYDIWGPLAETLITALIGTFAALATGAVCGLVVSNWAFVARVSRPFLIVLNAVPRVAMIPIIVLLVTASSVADALTAFTVIFFLAFYNAVEGASTVPMEMIHNGELLGAGKWRVMWGIRWPYALAWTFATLPNAIAFGLTGTITAEIFTGGAGLGYQMVLGIDNANATLLLTIVVIVAAAGVLLVLGANGLRSVLLPWWEHNQEP